jgi:mannose-1-phosphate guanylyltransferase/mannose-6-phosphate isomerase
MVNFVILCGGSGSRLWPRSREKMPKQLLSLTNENTMFQNTVHRINYLAKTLKNTNNENKLIVICNKEHSHIIETQLNEMELLFDYQIVSEPNGRDSAPAICIAALLGFITDYTFVLPCDHVFNDEALSPCFFNSYSYLENSIVTFGIKPTSIETGYGYIRVNNDYETEQFVEKPDYETAKKYVEEGCYLWNAGLFAFKNSNMIACFEKYAKDIYDNCLKTINETPISSKSFTLNENSFTTCRSISVDYAIMEPLCKDSESSLKKHTFLYDSLWNDIGSYSALYNELNKNEDGNVIKGDTISLKSHNCYIDSEHCLTAVIGVNNLIIVNTEDALLICDNQCSQDVKKVVEILKQSKRDEAFFHKKVFRPWGWYKNVEGHDYSGFKIKRIAVYPGKRLSLQSHNCRSEHWTIVKGNAKVQLNDETLLLNKDQSVYIPIKALHRIENIGEDLLEFIETQIGDYLGEDDIVRFEDDFGRIPAKNK